MKLDSRTYELLYYQYSPRLAAYASKIVGDGEVARDIVQDTFVKLWDKYGGKYSDSWAPVLFTITKNSCIDNLKKMAKDVSMLMPLNLGENEELLFLEDLFDSDSSAADSELLSNELEEKIQKITEQLPEKCRVVFEMSRVEGLKNDEIAQKVGVSVKAVEKQITKALKNFKKKL